MPDNQLIQSLTSGLLILVLIYLIAIPFYMNVEGLSLVDTFYFITITIATVGYGDITPQTTIEKLFTALLVLIGVSIFAYHITHIGRLKERTLDPHLQKRISLLKSLVAMKKSKVEESEIKEIKKKMVE